MDTSNKKSQPGEVGFQLSDFTVCCAFRLDALLLR